MPHDLVGFLILFFAALIVGIGFTLGQVIVTKLVR